MHNDYELLDSGGGRKLERFGAVVLSRPCAQAEWAAVSPELWASADASFDRDTGWQVLGTGNLPASWTVTINDIAFHLKPSPAGHLGVFPETRALWGRIADTLAVVGGGAGLSVLNLFAYSGGATLAAARTGSAVCHVDSSKSMVTRARENASLNRLDTAPIRWIVEDVGKFMGREIRRGRRYDAIILDPPSFGHGTRGEQYRIDRDLAPTVSLCKELLSYEPAFVLLTSHTQGVTTLQLEGLMREQLGDGRIESGAMELTGASDVRAVGSGVWVRWTRS